MYQRQNLAVWQLRGFHRRDRLVSVDTPAAKSPEVLGLSGCPRIVNQPMSIADDVSDQDQTPNNANCYRELTVLSAQD